MLEFLKSCFNSCFKSRYVKHLEAERERLLLREQQLMDALLKANGLPAVLAPRGEVKLPETRAKMMPSQWRRHIEARHQEKKDGEEKARPEAQGNYANAGK